MAQPKSAHRLGSALVEGTAPGADHKVTIVLADDHPVVRSGLRMLLEAEPDLEVVAEADDAGAAKCYVLGAAPPTPRYGSERGRSSGYELEFQGDVLKWLTQDIVARPAPAVSDVGQEKQYAAPLPPPHRDEYLARRPEENWCHSKSAPVDPPRHRNRPAPSLHGRTTSTFSCDIAYSRRPRGPASVSTTCRVRNRRRR
jgi:hypothetical protein